VNRTYPVLTLWQPHCSLVRERIKWAETRGYKAPKSIIGQTIAIHAAKRKPKEDQRVGDYIVHEMGDDSWAMQRVNSLRYIPLPLGAIVATARLVDCLPMIEDPGLYHSLGDVPKRCLLVGSLDHSSKGAIDSLNLLRDGIGTGATDQLPYGNFTPGRWAWILDQIEPVDPPVLFVGGQGFSKRWQR
jgi:hypothetical protein